MLFLIFRLWFIGRHFKAPQLLMILNPISDLPLRNSDPFRRKCSAIVKALKGHASDLDSKKDKLVFGVVSFFKDYLHSSSTFLHNQ